MNHKRHRPKHQRAGCLWCKPHKDEREADTEAAASRAAVAEGVADVVHPWNAAWDAEALDAQLLESQDRDETCSDPSCQECGGVRAEHIELAGDLRAPLALLARVA